MFDAIIFTDMSLHRQASMMLGPYKIAHVLRQRGFEVLVVNHLSHYNMTDLKELIDISLSSQTKFVGFSTTFMTAVQFDEETGEKINRHGWSPMLKDSPFPQGRKFGDEVFEYILAKHPSIKFVIGGRGGYGSENPYVNFWINGYAELSAVNLMNHLVHGEELRKSSVRDSGIVVISDPKAEDYDFHSDTMSWKKTDIVNHRVLPIETARGCIFSCKFCNFILNGKKNNKYIRMRDSIYDELMSNYTKFGIMHYYFVDDTVNENTIKLQMLAEVVEQLPFKPSFWAFTRLELLVTMPECIELMHKIGVRAMYFGIETMNMEAGKIVGKGFSREKQIELLRHIRTTYPDISLHGSFIAGLPKEPYDSIVLTLEQLSSNEIPLHSWSMRPLMIEKYDGGDKATYSEFDLNWEKYGYKELGVTDEKLIIWENDQGLLLADLARDLPKIIDESMRSKNYFVPGIDAFQLVNIGYDIDSVMSSNLYGFDWDEADLKTTEFVANYKKQMLSLLNQQKNS